MWMFEEQQRVWLLTFFDRELRLFLQLERRGVFDAP
jgi:hypothetical protein